MHSIRTEMVRCGLCNADDDKLLFYATDRAMGVPGQYGLVRCQRCGLSYTNPRPVAEDLPKCYPAIDYFGLDCASILPTSQMEDKLSWKGKLRRTILSEYRNYPRIPEETLLRTFIRLTKPFLQSIMDRFPRLRAPPYTEAGLLIDIGCGTGEALREFRNLGWKTAGTDLSLDACRYARKNHNIDAFHTAGNDLPFPDNSVAVIYMNNSLEHIPEPRTFLAEAQRILQKEGRIVIETPNFDCRQAHRLQHLWRGIEIPRHLYHYTSDSLTKLLETAGFTNIMIKPIVASPYNIFCAEIPPTPANNKRFSNAWWQTAYITMPLFLLGPNLGLGDSLYATALKKNVPNSEQQTHGNKA